MSARILVVDDLQTNVKLLEARLQAEYYDVRSTLSGRDAIEIARSEHIDLILLDVMMPGITGFEVCRELKADVRTAHIPIVMVTALDEPQDRVKGLECGADDFLTKPVSEIALLTRVRSLIRLKMLTDELNLRVAAMRSMGVAGASLFASSPDVTGRILVVDDRASSAAKVRAALDGPYDVGFESDSARALSLAGESAIDLFIVSLQLQSADGLRLCSQMKATDRTRAVPVLLLTDPDDTARLMRALDLGVNDYLIRPIDINELRARVRTQLRRKAYADRLRAMVSNAMEQAVIDPLTGLHNRRFLEGHLRSLVERSMQASKPVSLLIFDIDHFKRVNDTSGHDAGDDVLVEFALRLKTGVRGIDLVARLGGEEFVVVMPETDAAGASVIAERLRRAVECAPFTTRAAQHVSVTVSIGVADVRKADDTPDALLKRADQALYAAKRDGRNRVVADAA